MTVHGLSAAERDYLLIVVNAIRSGSNADHEDNLEPQSRTIPLACLYMLVQQRSLMMWCERIIRKRQDRKASSGP